MSEMNDEWWEKIRREPYNTPAPASNTALPTKSSPSSTTPATPASTPSIPPSTVKRTLRDETAPEVMTIEETNAILIQVKQGALSAQQAISRLVAGGMKAFTANNRVFITLGGDDIIVTGKDGVARYDYSGKSVEEVDRLMEQ